ncbi:chitinase 1 [Fusarium beomiforme]|uniref:chitinase n=1 Tax=Fusarium beomiforme TaxID=44412 RepID=A0A9P5APC1_9HYPO|nr:chitinase 1 [Fusarium beomiforme]
MHQRNFQPRDLPASTLNHVLYAFVDVQSDGTVYSNDTKADLGRDKDEERSASSEDNVFGGVQQMYVLKKAHRNLKVLLSIGGWNWSTNFTMAASTATTRSNFAKSAVTLMKDWGFDGIDVDWEYPKDSADADNMVLLLQAIRDELDAYADRYASGYHFQLSMAAPAGSTHYSKLRLSDLGRVVDYINLMAYDYVGIWSSATGHNANLYPNMDTPQATPFNTDDAVNAYLNAGVPANKLVLGMPIYARSFLGASGMGKPYSDVGSANPTLGSWENGVWDYKALSKLDLEIMNDEKAQAQYGICYTSQDIYSYDTPEIVRKKVAYLKERGLGGAMFWEASGDETGENSLVKASFDALGSIDQTTNLLKYPDSRYRNIASNMRQA